MNQSMCFCRLVTYLTHNPYLTFFRVMYSKTFENDIQSWILIVSCFQFLTCFSSSWTSWFKCWSLDFVRTDCLFMCWKAGEDLQWRSLPQPFCSSWGKKKIQSQNNYLKIYLYFLNFVYLYFLGEERRQKGEKGKENGRKG